MHIYHVYMPKPYPNTSTNMALWNNVCGISPNLLKGNFKIQRKRRLYKPMVGWMAGFGCGLACCRVAPEDAENPPHRVSRRQIIRVRFSGSALGFCVVIMFESAV